MKLRLRSPASSSSPGREMGPRQPQVAPGLGHGHRCKVPMSPAWSPQPSMDGLRGYQCPAQPAACACDGTGPTEVVASSPVLGWGGAGGLCLHQGSQGCPHCGEQRHLSPGASPFPSADGQGQGCSNTGAGGWWSHGAGKVTRAPTASGSSTPLLPALSQPSRSRPWMPHARWAQDWCPHPPCPR